MRELVPYFVFLSVAFSSIYLGVGTRRGAAPGRGSPTTTGATTSSEGTPATTALHEPRAARVLRGFYGVTPPAELDPKAIAPTTKDYITRLRDSLTVEQRRTIKPMIAIVSDPIESSVHHFDQTLEALQRGFEAEGFVIDRHDLTWSDAGARSAAGSEPAAHREAGALLFRKKRERKPELHDPLTADGVLVLIVGENAIAGIHKPAMYAALDVVEAWNAPTSEQAGRLDVHILGPTYSGSTLSLQSALRSWFDAQRRDVFVQIVSGSAMAPDNKDYLEMRLLGPERHCLLVNFHATFLTTKEVLDTFEQRYLYERLQIQPHEIVMLAEANTSYGASARKASDESSEPGDESTPSQAPPSKASRKQAGDKEKHDGILTISYPISIGQMRAAYERQEVLRLPAAGSDNGTAPRSLELRLEQNSRATDLPPTFSDATPAHVERVVIALLDAVRHENRRYVGLMGTSVEDRLFLAQLIRFHCPDVHLFCIDNNLIYTNPRFNRALEGMLIASPYPLYPEQILWRPAAANIPLNAFPSDEANGIYIACRVVASRLQGGSGREVAAEYGSPFPEQNKQPGASGRPVIRPPIWVMQVGRGAILPVAVLPTIDYSGPSRQEAAKSPPNKNSVDEIDREYTLRLDEDWQRGRREQLLARGGETALDLRSALPPPSAIELVPEPAALAAVFEHRRFYDDVYAAWSLLVLLATCYLIWRRRGFQTQPPSALDNCELVEVRAINMLLIVLAVLQVVLLLPVAIALRNPPVGAWQLNAYRFLSVAFGVSVAAIVVRAAVSERWWSARHCVHDQYAEAREAAERHCRQAHEPVKFWLLVVARFWESNAVPALCVFCALGALAALACVLLAATWSGHNYEWLLAMERACTPFARLCPLMPLAVVLSGFCLILTTRAMRAGTMKQVVQSRQYAPWKFVFRDRDHRPLPPASNVVHEAQQAIGILDRQAAIPDDPLALMIMLVVVAAWVGWLLWASVRLTVLSTGWEVALRLAIFGLSLAAVCMISGSLSLGRALLSLLDAFDLTAWTPAFKRLGTRYPLVQQSLRRQLFSRRPLDFKPNVKPHERDGLVSAAERIAERPELDTASQEKLRGALMMLREDDANVAVVQGGAALLEALAAADVRERVDPLELSVLEGRVRDCLLPHVAGLTMFLLARLARRMLATFVAVIFLLLALDSYPFQPHRFLLIAQWCITGSAIAMASYIFLSLNRNATLSTLAGTPPGLTLDSHLLSQGLLFLVVPLLTILSLHFPELSNFFGSAATAVQAVKL